MATKHVPIRTCIATGEKKPKGELMRLVINAEGRIIVDPRDKAKGRGANLTMTGEAFDLAIKKRALQRALKFTGKLTDADIAALKQEFLDAIAEKQFRPAGKSVTIKVSQEKLAEITAPQSNI